jgi:hypothetical protein
MDNIIVPGHTRTRLRCECSQYLYRDCNNELKCLTCDPVCATCKKQYSTANRLCPRCGSPDERHCTCSKGGD